MKLSDIFPGWALRREKARRQLTEENLLRKTYSQIESSLPAFAQDRDEGKWKTVGGSSREPFDHTAYDIDEMQEHALELSYRPGGRGLLDMMEAFVIGKETAVHALDENEEVQDYWDEWAKLNGWDMRSKEMFGRLLRDGEVFLRWFSPLSLAVGQDSPACEKVRFVEPNQISDAYNKGVTFGIETDPQDVETVVAYHRAFAVNGQDAKEVIPASDMMHFKIMVDANVKRGRSWLIGVSEYIRKHEEWLDLRIQLNRVRSLFAVIGKVDPAGSISTLKNKFADVQDKTLSGEGTKKKMPKNALVLLQKGIEWDLKDLNLNATDAAQDGRNIQLYICAGTGLAEYVVRGDASNSNFASTMVSESPMVKTFEKYQDIWAKIQQAIFKRVTEFGLRTGQIPKMSTKTAPDETTETIETVTECSVQFPTLIHRDIDKETTSYQVHRQNGWASDRTISSKLGYDYDEEQEEIDRAEKRDAEREKQIARMPYDQDRDQDRDRQRDKDAQTAQG